MYRMRMWRSIKLTFGIIGILLVETNRGQSAPLMVDRRNFGFTLIKRGELQLATASANLLFHYELPPITATKEEQINCSILIGEGHQVICGSLRPALEVIQDLESQASKHLQSRLNHIYDALYYLHI